MLQEESGGWGEHAQNSAVGQKKPEKMGKNHKTAETLGRSEKNRKSSSLKATLMLWDRVRGYGWEGTFSSTQSKKGINKKKTLFST